MEPISCISLTGAIMAIIDFSNRNIQYANNLCNSEKHNYNNTDDNELDYDEQIVINNAKKKMKCFYRESNTGPSHY